MSQLKGCRFYQTWFRKIHSFGFAQIYHAGYAKGNYLKIFFVLPKWQKLSPTKVYDCFTFTDDIMPAQPANECTAIQDFTDYVFILIVCNSYLYLYL